VARSVTRLAEQPARRLYVAADSTGVALASTNESQALRAGLREQGQAGIEPA
jgi:hypothetical protein